MAGRGCVAQIARRDDRESIDGPRAVFGAIVDAARPVLVQLMMVLALAGGLLAAAAPAQAASESYAATGTGIYKKFDGSYTTQPSISVYYTGNSGLNEDVASYARFSIPANKVYSSASLSHAHTCNFGSGVPINFTLLISEPMANGPGITSIRISTRVGGVTAGSGASVDSLPSVVLNEMNRLSAAGGGTLRIGVSTVGGTSVLCGFNTFNLLGETTGPAIWSVSPNGGPAGGANTVTISGSNLNGATSVTFGGSAGTNISASANEITVTAPAHAVGAVDVVVTTPTGNATASGAYTYLAPPTISSISPNVGPTSGVYTVTVSGTNLNNATSITFGGVTGAIMNRTATTLEVATPALWTPRTVDVVVTTPGGTATAVNGFTAVDAPTISSVSPNRGPLAGTNAVMISGTNLAGASVTFGGSMATNVSASATTITANVPAHAAGAVNVVVTTPGGTATQINGYTYAAAPTANAFTAAAVTYNTGSASTSPIELSSHVSGVAWHYGLNNGGAGAGLITTAQGGRASVNTATGHVDYTPPVGFRGNDTFQYSVDGTNNWATVTIPVNNPVFTVTLAETQGYVGVDYNTANAPVTISGGKGPYTITEVTGYPRSLAFNASSQVLSGTVRQRGSWTVNFTITDSSTGAGPYTSTVSAALETSFAPAPTASDFTTPAVAYNTGSASATIIDLTPHVSGYIERYYLHSAPNGGYSLTTAQGGAANVDGITGQVSYVPPVGFRGVDSFEYRADSSGGHSGWKTVTVPVNDPVFTVTLPSATGLVGADYNASSTPVTVSGGKGPYTITAATGYPRNLSFDPATGVLTGRIAESGTWTVNVTVTDSSTGTGPSTSTVSAVLVTTPPPPPTATSFTSPAVAYRSGPASETIIDLTGHVGGVVTSYNFNNGSGTPTKTVTTAQGGSATVDNTGQARYTPPAGFRGADSFQFRPSNPAASGSWVTVTIPVNDPVFTVSLPETTGQIGVDYNRSNIPVTISGGRGPYTVTAVTGYPRALTFDASSQVLSGRVTEDGTWTVGFTITDSSTGTGGHTSNTSATLITTFPPRPVAASFTAPAVAYNTGSASPAIIDLAPHGSGVVQGYALRDGIYVSFSVTTAQGGTAVLDAGATQVRYTPPVGFRGNDSFQYASENAGGPSITATVTIPVSNPVFTVTLPETTGVVGAPYNSGGVAVTVGGGNAPYADFSATGLPAGLTMNSAGVISGVPTTATNATVVVTATDSSTGAGGFTSTASASIRIAAPTIVLTPAAGGLPGAVGGTAYSQTFTSTGGIAPMRYQVTAGALPNGLGLSTGGFISGTPTATGTFNFTVTATDGSGNAYATSGAYSITVTAPAITLTAPIAGTLPGGLRTVAYSQTFTATGGTAPYGYAVTGGALPLGLTLAPDGALSGTPTTAGSHAFTITASDAFGFTGAATYTLEIGTPVPVVQAQTATVIGGQSVTIDVAQGATGLDFASVSVATPPSHGTAAVQGLSIVYTADGAYAGPDSFTYTVNNAGGPSAPGTVSITVNPAVVAGPVKTATIFAGQRATVDLTEGATGSPFTAAAVVSVGPTGAGTAIVIPRTGQGGVQRYDLVFTPADSFTGEATVLYTLSNAFATSAPGTVTITVEARPDPGLDPEVRGVATGQVTAARRFADTQISNFQRRLQTLRDGTNDSSNGLSLNLGLSNTDEDRDPRSALRRQLGRQTSHQDPGALGDGRDREMLGLDLWAGRSRIDPAAPSPITGDRLNALPTRRVEEGGVPSASGRPDRSTGAVRMRTANATIASPRKG